MGGYPEIGDTGIAFTERRDASMKRNSWRVWMLSVGLLAAAVAPAEANDYPTVAVADYVFGCMASNGQTQRALEQCSCSIDVIASILPYEVYVEAETIARMRQVSGEKGAIFRNNARYKEIVGDLKRAQVEAELRCF